MDSPPPPPPTDYDALSPTYDRCPFRWERGPDPDLAAFLRDRAARVRILEIACGTGIQMALNARAWDAARLLAVGVDRSAGMLAEARKKLPAGVLARADGTRLPFANATFDYLCCQFASHHVRPFARLVTEAGRVLAPGGRFVLWNIDPWGCDNPWFYRYFPECRALDEARFLPVPEQMRLLAAAGFTVSTRRTARTERLAPAEILALLSDRTSLSQLTLIPDAAYAERLAAARRDLEHDAQVRTVPGFPLVWLTATR